MSAREQTKKGDLQKQSAEQRTYGGPGRQNEKQVVKRPGSSLALGQEAEESNWSRGASNAKPCAPLSSRNANLNTAKGHSFKNQLSAMETSRPNTARASKTQIKFGEKGGPKTPGSSGPKVFTFGQPEQATRVAKKGFDPIEQVRKLGKQRQLKGDAQAGDSSRNFSSDLEEIKAIIERTAKERQGRNWQVVSLAALTSELIGWIDERNLGQAEVGILDFILRQPSLRDSFRQQYLSQDNEKLTEKLLMSLQHNSNRDSFCSKELLLRFVAHVCFCKADTLSSQLLLKVIKAVRWMILKPMKVAENDKQRIQEQQNMTKAALNCVTNIYNREHSKGAAQTGGLQESVKTESESTFNKIKDLFLFLMRNIQNNYRSTRSIIMLTTVIRALQHVLDTAIQHKKIKLSDSDTIILFFEFYKLVFLGTKFTARVLQIRVSAPTSQMKQKDVVVHMDTGAAGMQKQSNSTEDNPLVMIVDTSEAYSSDNLTGKPAGSSTGSGQFHSQQNQDSYAKIKTHAMACLLILFKANNKAFKLNTLWHPIFPSFFMQPRPDMASASTLLSLIESPHARSTFASKVSKEVMKEPSLFYLTLACADNSLQFRQMAFLALNTLLENSDLISKWQYILERKNGEEVQSESLGFFLRMIHYYAICKLETESESGMLQSHLKLCSTLLEITPYVKMLPGLSLQLTQCVFEQLRDESSLLSQFSARAPATTVYALRTCQHGFEAYAATKQQYRSAALQGAKLMAIAVSQPEALPSITSIYGEAFFSHGKDIIDTIICRGLLEESESFDTNEAALALLAKAAQTFPETLSSLWSAQFEASLAKLLFKNCKTVEKASQVQIPLNATASAQSKQIEAQSSALSQQTDQRKVLAVCKFLRDWLLQFSQFESKEGAEQEAISESLACDSSKSPLQHQSFANLVKALFSREFARNCITETLATVLEILPAVARQSDWTKLFPTKASVDNLLTLLLEQDLQRNERATVQAVSSSNTALKAVQIQSSARLISSDWLANAFPEFVSAAFQLVIESQSDSSVQIQARCSQATKDLVCFFVKQGPSEADSQRMQQLLEVVLTFASSEKLKVSANALRALAFFLGGTKLNSVADASAFLPRVRQIVHAQLSNQSAKVCWNACIVVAKTIKNETLVHCVPSAQNIFFDTQTVQLLLDLVAKKQNIKARIQAINSLLAYRQLDQLGGAESVGLVMDAISECLHYKSHFGGSTAELNYLDAFEDGFLALWQATASFMLEAKEARPVHAYLNSNSTFTLLQRVTNYLRRELQVPQYSGVFTSESEFDQDTQRLFAESLGNRLFSKISKVKVSLEKLLETIESTDEIKVSFSVFEGINQLAKSQVQEYRRLRVLQEIKSSFNATFAGEGSEEESKSKAAAASH